MYYPCSIISQKPPPLSGPPVADPDRSLGSLDSANKWVVRNFDGPISDFMCVHDILIIVWRCNAIRHPHRLSFYLYVRYEQWRETKTGRESLMEGTKDDESPLPNPEPLSPKALLQRRKAKGKASGSGRARATREMLMERDRRGKMNEFYAKLNSMVPNLFPKATREKTIDETIAYIREVEEQIMELEAQKEMGELERLHGRRNSSSSIDVTFSGETMFFGIQSMARKGLLTRVLQVFERHKAEVLATSIACNDGQQAMVNVTAVFSHSDRMVLPPEMAGQRIKTDLLSSL